MQALFFCRNLIRASVGATRKLEAYLAKAVPE
jgi:hypothetical protein